MDRTCQHQDMASLRQSFSNPKYSRNNALAQEGTQLDRMPGRKTPLCLEDMPMSLLVGSTGLAAKNLVHKNKSLSLSPVEPQLWLASPLQRLGHGALVVAQKPALFASPGGQPGEQLPGQLPLPM